MIKIKKEEMNKKKKLLLEKIPKTKKASNIFKKIIYCCDCGKREVIKKNESKVKTLCNECFKRKYPNSKRKGSR